MESQLEKPEARLPLRITFEQALAFVEECGGWDNMEMEEINQLREQAKHMPKEEWVKAYLYHAEEKSKKNMKKL